MQDVGYYGAKYELIFLFRFRDESSQFATTKRDCYFFFLASSLAVSKMQGPTFHNTKKCNQPPFLGDGIPMLNPKP